MKKVNKSEGFTLVEVLVAMTIISIIALAFFRVLNNTIRMNEKTDKDIQIMDIAQSKMENMLADIREGTKNKTDIEVKINNEVVKLDDLFKGNNTIYPEKNDSSYKTEEYIYKDGNSKYLVDLKIQKEKVGNSKVLDDCYLYNINYTVSEKNKIFSNREVSLSSSILSLK